MMCVYLSFTDSSIVYSTVYALYACVSVYRAVAFDVTFTSVWQEKRYACARYEL